MKKVDRDCEALVSVVMVGPLMSERRVSPSLLKGKVMDSVGIIIVTSDSEYCIDKCLSSVSALKMEIKDIVVVDNSSRDQTVAIVEKYAQRVRMICREGRHSLSNNLNIALEGMNVDYVLILNPDIVLPPQAAGEMASFLEGNRLAGACAPALVFPDGTLQLSCRRFPTPWSVLIRRTPLRLFFSHADRGKHHLMVDGNHDLVQEVDWALGACVMFRMKALRQVGWFDESFRLYCEDIDICHRLWAAGWSVLYDPRVRVAHEHRAISDKRFLSRHSWWHYRSMAHYFGKYGSRGFTRPSSRRQGTPEPMVVSE
jgi:N-acetylglucosaminyl-diphospho-decaprenol L-rhamnosyltransferase